MLDSNALFRFHFHVSISKILFSITLQGCSCSRLITFSYFGLQLESTHSMWVQFSYFGMQLESIHSMWMQFSYFGLQLESTHSMWRQFSYFGLQLVSSINMWMQFSVFNWNLLIVCGRIVTGWSCSAAAARGFQQSETFQH